MLNDDFLNILEINVDPAGDDHILYHSNLIGSICCVSRDKFADIDIHSSLSIKMHTIYFLPEFNYHSKIVCGLISC